jgi:hypothetical protein
MAQGDVLQELGKDFGIHEFDTSTAIDSAWMIGGDEAEAEVLFTDGHLSSVRKF